MAAESLALGPHRMEAVENRLAQLRRDTGALVIDADEDVVADMDGGDFDQAVSRRKADGIVDDIVDGARQPARLAHDDGAVASRPSNFLDISMPPFEEKGIISGEDLARLIMELMPNCKIILLTMFTELLKIKNIIETINPAGLVIKNDLTFDELLFGFDLILKDEVYYSHSVIKMAKQADNTVEDIDQFDKLILFHISKGTKTKDIPQFVPISLHAIESRKVNLKELFQIEDGSDIDLIREAKNRGIIF